MMGLNSKTSNAFTGSSIGAHQRNRCHSVTKDDLQIGLIYHQTGRLQKSLVADRGVDRVESTSGACLLQVVD